jgi:nicotinate-nucleotide pyrophosphorylase (carboxylating)
MPVFGSAPSSFILYPSSFILHPSSFILHPSSFILHPSSFILHPSSLIPYLLAMNKEFGQAVWNEDLEQDWLRILVLALSEDLGSLGDCTTEALVPEHAQGRAAVVVRHAGVLAGEAAIAAACNAGILPACAGLKWFSQAHDGESLASRRSIGVLEGPARAMLAMERPLLNMLGRLAGIASLTRRYVDAVSGTRAGIYDTRKTTPGWRSLEKYAVRCGGGRNHRAGLFEAVLIKDNHLAVGAALRPQGAGAFGPAEAVHRARQFLVERWGDAGREMIVEIGSTRWSSSMPSWRRGPT